MLFKYTSQITVIALALLLTGCASNGLEHRPAVTNSDLANYEVDLKHCQDSAANDQALNKTAEGGFAGAASGAIAGALSDGSDIITGAVVGAIIGAAGGNMFTQEKQRDHIIQCMQELGYNVEANN